jgi:hypothetical protein
VALVSCPECKRDVSDQALACLVCGRPLTPVTPALATPADVQASEQTRKRRKAVQLIGGTFMALGLLACLGEHRQYECHCRTTRWDSGATICRRFRRLARWLVVPRMTLAQRE